MTQFDYNSFIPIKDKDLKDKTIDELIFQNLQCYDYYEEYNPNNIYLTKELAIVAARDDRITTIQIEWEE